MSYNQPYMRIVTLSSAEREHLEYLQKHSANSVERNRSLCLLLSSQGNSMQQVAKLMNIHWVSVKRLLDVWESVDSQKRFSVLRPAKGQGAKVKLKSIATQIPKILDKNNRNLHFVLEDIEKQYGIKVCKLTLQNFLKDAGLYLETNPKIPKA